MKRIIITCVALIALVPGLYAQKAKAKKVTKPKAAAVKTGCPVLTTADSLKIYEAVITQKQLAASAAASAIEAAKKAAEQTVKTATDGIIPPSTTPPSTIDQGSQTTTATPSTGSSSSNVTNNDIISGLKEALKIGTDNSSKKLNKIDGFFADAAIKILMPAEAQKVEKTLRSIGMGGLVDNVVLSMNRAAEDAAGGIGDIFWTAIKQMNITDGIQILRGGDFAATNYLKKTTTAVLTEKFRPVIESSLGKTGATKYWKDAFSAYNSFSSTPVNTDLSAYVTEKALTGLFYNISLEEQKIRKDPVAQVTGLLKKVFGGIK